MRESTVLVANRGEIAMRLIAAAADLGLGTVAVYAADDADSAHVALADRAVALDGRGAAAYLDGTQLIAAARQEGATLVHPGYGFLSENPAFARGCAEAGLVFVGPDADTLARYAAKTEARALAQSLGVPVIPASAAPLDLAGAGAFLASEGAIMLKARAGGGGRGMRVIRDAGELPAALAACAGEAERAFGDPALYAEKLLTGARHVEVQIIGDGEAVVALGERECSVQRRQQKLVEFAPAPALDPALRDGVTAAALTLAQASTYRSLGTFEFLVADGQYYFLEANPRLQVEHTVTEAITGVDLVAAQLRLALGERLADLALPESGSRGVAVQLRVNMERLAADGTVKASGGTLTRLAPPAGPGIRVDTFGYPGYRTAPGFDSLLAKVVIHAPDWATLRRRADRALASFDIAGVDTNRALLRALLAEPGLTEGAIDTAFVDRELPALLARAQTFEAPADNAPGGAGARIDHRDPLAVLAHGKAPSATAPPAAAAETALAPGEALVRAPMQGTVISLAVEDGAEVAAGAELAIMDAMKMEHVITAPVAGRVRRVHVAAGEAVFEDHPLVLLEALDGAAATAVAETAVDLDAIRPDLAEVLERHAIGLDEHRPEAVAKRRKTGHQTARENVAQLVDPGTFVEYGPLVVAAQRRRRSLAELIEKTPGDGMVAGIGSINGELFPDRRAQCAVLTYDYTVLAGTQGGQNHRKKDRLFELARHLRLPVVMFAEGGGGRPGDTDGIGSSGLDCLAFRYFGELSGLVPLVGVTSGRCFAGNAALLGCCDVVIATEGSNIGMGGPAMIEGGGLGVFRPEEVGPLEVQRANGVVDLVVRDYGEAVATAKRYLSYFQGPLADWECADQRRLRHLIPENRLRVYDIRQVIDTLADTGSVLELRRDFGHGMVTALARIEGRPVGLIANNPAHLSGAIDSPGADKAARFMQLCDAFDLPLVILCDTPGIMVGPEVEKTALVRHAARLFVTAGSLSVPVCTFVLRKGYGLGAQAMAAGSFKATVFTVAWPTGEFGGMGLEGAVKLGYRNELAAIEDPEQRAKAFEERVARMYEHGKAVSTASFFEIDDVIDPMSSRHWITAALKAAPPPLPREGKKRACVDTW